MMKTNVTVTRNAIPIAMIQFSGSVKSVRSRKTFTEISAETMPMTEVMGTSFFINALFVLRDDASMLSGGQSTCGAKGLGVLLILSEGVDQYLLNVSFGYTSDVFLQVESGRSLRVRF